MIISDLLTSAEVSPFTMWRDAIFFEGKFWLGRSRYVYHLWDGDNPKNNPYPDTLDSFPVLWCCDTWTRTTQAYNDNTISKIDVGQAVGVTLQSDALSVNGFAVIEGDLWAFGYVGDISARYASFWSYDGSNWTQRGISDVVNPQAYNPSNGYSNETGYMLDWNVYMLKTDFGIYTSSGHILRGRTVSRINGSSIRPVIFRNRMYTSEGSRYDHALLKSTSIDGIESYSAANRPGSNKFPLSGHCPLVRYNDALYGVSPDIRHYGNFNINDAPSYLLRVTDVNNHEPVALLPRDQRNFRLLFAAAGRLFFADENNRVVEYQSGRLDTPQTIDMNLFDVNFHNYEGIVSGLAFTNYSSGTENRIPDVYTVSFGTALYDIELGWEAVSQVSGVLEDITLNHSDLTGGDGSGALQDIALSYSDGDGDASATLESIMLTWENIHTADAPAQLNNIELNYSDGDGDESVELDEVSISWQDEFIPPDAITERILYATNTDTLQAVGIMIALDTDNATEQQIRAAVRCDMESFAVDAWETYQIIQLNTLTKIQAPGNFVRVAIVGPESISPPDFYIQLKREETE